MVARTRFTVPVAPVTKKNSGQIVTVKGRPMLIPSKRYNEYEKLASPYCPDFGIDYPVNVKTVFYMKTRRRVDIANLISAAHDLLVHAGTLTDDNSKIIVSVDGSRVEYDKENPRTEFEIERIERSNQNA